LWKGRYRLTYQPAEAEHFQNPLILGELVKDIFKECSDGKRTVVGYKEGHVEKDLLKKLAFLLSI